MRSYRLVAESLRQLDALPAFIPGGPGEGYSFGSALLHQPGDESNVEPPAFLKFDQIDSWRRVMAALTGWQAAVLAEPVGHGKSWIALAVAKTLDCTVAMIAPAALRGQWDDAAHRIGLTAPFTSLEMLSRGRLPDDRSRLVVVDEAHRLRHWNTKRVEHLAPWLPGRKVLLVTGTPIVNSPRDLVAILRLVVADDALRLDGIGSLEELATDGRPPGALRRLVIRGAGDGTRTTLTRTTLDPGSGENARGRRAVAQINRLRGAGSATVSRLIKHLMLDAAASSDAAWHLAARRYRGMLLHAREAGGISRSALRSFIAGCPDQTVMWPLMGELGGGDRLPLVDLDVLADILAAPPLDESWMDSVGSLLGDRTPTLCFTRYVATAHALRMYLGNGTAWVTGSAAGVGPHRLGREAVLAAFGPDRARWNTLQRLPDHLILTEVGAEGLNLQGAQRVLHLDLPWHAVGKAQRVGRVVRRGQMATSIVEVIRRPPAAVARLLGREAMVERKGKRANEWMQIISGCTAATAQVPQESPERAAIVVLRSGERVGSLALVKNLDGWQLTSRDRVVELSALDLVSITGAGAQLAARGEPGLLEAIASAVRSPRVARPRLVKAIMDAARISSRSRDFVTLRRLNALLSMASRSHPLGVERWLDGLDAREMESPSIAIERRAPPPRLVWCAILGRAVADGRTATQIGVSALGP